MSVWTSAIRPATSSVTAPSPAARSCTLGAALEERVRAHDQVDAGGHHRRGVDERADRRRALHRVRQPGVQRDLRRLRDRAAEQAERDQRSSTVEPSAVRRARTPTSKSSVPVCWISRKSASAIVASPTAFMMNAFLAAAIALGRSWRKPISRYEREADEAPADEQEQQVAAAGRAAASRRRTAPCRRRSAAPRRRRPCSRSSRRRSATPTPATISIMKTESGSTRIAQADVGSRRR